MTAAAVLEPPAAAARPTEAEPPEELFDIYNEQGQLIGQDKRAVVHKLGLLHKAVYCFVFNPQGQLLIQQRSQHKKIGPGQWDLSVAEHLSPGEEPHALALQCQQQMAPAPQQQHQLHRQMAERVYTTGRTSWPCMNTSTHAT
jgi:isopentenyldiphosphate isomerase